MLSLGGATFSSVWANLDDTKISALVSAIKTTLTQQYPIYSSNFANEADFVGYATIHGIDLDVELGDNRLDATTSAGVVKLVKALASAMPEKLVTLATFSVGADPAGACTVTDSIHCGEARDLLSAIVDDIDFVNVMAYDAG
jgi:hypothetical protein